MRTADLIGAMCPRLPPAKAESYGAALDAAMPSAGITTDARRVAFLAQLAHESCGFVYSEEIWGATPAQRGYEGRADLGNTQPGDGYRYRGRAWMQLTGRGNYAAAEARLHIPLVLRPELAAQPVNSALISCDYWQHKRLPFDRYRNRPDGRYLNQMADDGDFTAITHAINGGENGMSERYDYLDKGLKALAAQPPTLAAAPGRVFLTALDGTVVLMTDKEATYSGAHILRHDDGAVSISRA